MAVTADVQIANLTLYIVIFVIPSADRPWDRWPDHPEVQARGHGTFITAIEDRDGQIPLQLTLDIDLGSLPSPID